MNSRLVPAWASMESLADTPPAWSTTSPDQTCTRSSLKPMVFFLSGRVWLHGRIISRRRGGRKENREIRAETEMFGRALRRQPDVGGFHVSRSKALPGNALLW